MIQRLEVALAVVLITAGAASLLLYRFVFVDPADSNDWEQASAWVVANAGPDDVVRIEPHWFDAGLIPLGEVGDRVQRIRAPIVEDMHGHKTVWVVSDSTRVDRAREALPWVNAFEEKAFGTATVLRADLPPDGIVWELRNALGSAKVYRVRGDDVESCDRFDATKKRWDCRKRDRWKYVGEAHREVGDEPRACVWAHPLDKGRTLRIEATVPPADRIRIRDSFDLRAARLQGAPVLMQVWVDDRLELEDRVAGDDDDWQAHDIDVSDRAGPVELRIEIDLLGSIKNRFFCINAWAFADADLSQ